MSKSVFGHRSGGRAASEDAGSVSTEVGDHAYTQGLVQWRGPEPGTKKLDTTKVKLMDL